MPIIAADRWTNGRHGTNLSIHTQKPAFNKHVKPDSLSPQAYGVHINGYVGDAAAAGGHRLWVARRSATKPTWPGMLDHIVAGGQVRSTGDTSIMSSTLRGAQEGSVVRAS